MDVIYSSLLPSTKSNDGISFKNDLIFGKGFSRAAKDGSVVTKMLSNGTLLFNGAIDKNQLSILDKKTVWLYLRYIWKCNKNNPAFDNTFYGMTSSDFTDAASALGFVRNVIAFEGTMDINSADTNALVKAASELRIETLIDYVNDIVNQHKEYIEIPILQNVIQLVMDKLLSNSDVPKNDESIPVAINYMDSSGKIINGQKPEEYNILRSANNNGIIVSIKV